MALAPSAVRVSLSKDSDLISFKLQVPLSATSHEGVRYMLNIGDRSIGDRTKTNPRLIIRGPRDSCNSTHARARTEPCIASPCPLAALQRVENGAAPRCDSLRRVVVPTNISDPPTTTSPFIARAWPTHRFTVPMLGVYAPPLCLCLRVTSRARVSWARFGSACSTWGPVPRRTLETLNRVLHACI
jgi:hypothetical protein